MAVCHFFGIAMISSNQDNAAGGGEGLHYPAKAIIHRFAGFDRRRDYATVTHHVAVGKVKDHQGVR